MAITFKGGFHVEDHKELTKDKHTKTIPDCETHIYPMRQHIGAPLQALVKKGVNKIEIAKAVEEIYNVKVTSVNVIVTPEKKKRVGRYYGRTTEKRKAIVTLAEGDSITLF